MIALLICITVKIPDIYVVNCNNLVQCYLLIDTNTGKDYCMYNISDIFIYIFFNSWLNRKFIFLQGF
jgi:hypothetical protein